MRSPKDFGQAGQPPSGALAAVQVSRRWMIVIISPSTCLLRAGGALRRPVAVLTRFGATAWTGRAAADERRRFFGAVERARGTTGSGSGSGT